MFRVFFVLAFGVFLATSSFGASKPVKHKQPNTLLDSTDPTESSGKTMNLSTGAIVGISVGAVGAVAVFLVIIFAVFICCLRRKLPEGAPKPPICTTVKLACGMLAAKCCPCCGKSQYGEIPGN